MPKRGIGSKVFSELRKMRIFLNASKKEIKVFSLWKTRDYQGGVVGGVGDEGGGHRNKT
ncbi:MAG: hypothetical protein J5701_01135 [Bacteroidales bacterium]|nr:hypothetical protein [Bacteroidales bacterium]